MNQQSDEEEKTEGLLHIPDIVMDESMRCNFSLMEKLPGHWNRWTGNIAPSADISGIVPPKGKSGITKETVKIPFKPPAWQRGAHHRPKQLSGSGFTEDALLGDIEGLDLAGSSRRTSRQGDDGSEAAVNPSTKHFQRAYGSVRFQSYQPSMYWARLSMTESVMSSPDFQHLSSDKYHALEHFSALRTFKDQEVIVNQAQVFFSIFYIR